MDTAQLFRRKLVVATIVQFIMFLLSISLTAWLVVVDGTHSPRAAYAANYLIGFCLGWICATRYYLWGYGKRCRDGYSTL